MQVDPSEIIQIIKDSDTQVDMDALNFESDLRNIGADSLDMMNIFLAIQENYNVEIPDEEIENLPNVAAICRFLGRQ
jgi:acyl carrier protein